MRMKRVIACLLSLTLCPLVHAAALDLAKFQVVKQTISTNMIRDASQAYGRKHYDEAFEKFQRLACAGDKQSQSALGRMYMLGEGTKRDDLTGYAWLKLAAEMVYPKYQAVVKQIEMAMTPEQSKVAGELVADLSARYSFSASRMGCTLSASKGGHIIDQIICTPQNQGTRLLLRKCDIAAAQ